MNIGKRADQVKEPMHQHVKHVVQGQVQCPKFGQIDVESCFYCPQLTSIELDRPVPFIVCSAEAAATAEQQRILADIGLLELAKAIGNVSEACRMRGVSRKYFYDVKKRLMNTQNSFYEESLPGDSVGHRRRLAYGPG